MNWPKLPDGTVDWMTVFQDPNSGLIALIDQSDTSEKLQACFRYLIDTLFARDGDADIRQGYYEILEETFSGASDDRALQGQKVKIRMVMMRVMNDRIRLAREFAAMNAGAAAPRDGPRRIDDPQLDTVPA